MLINENPRNVYINHQLDIKKLLNQTKISIVIPMYNEENSILSVIQRIPHFPNYEIVVVDDGSTDNSRTLIEEHFPSVRLIKHIVNKGYGKTLIDGITHAEGDIVVFLDSDGQHEPRDIPHLLEPILNNQADYVIGSRYTGKRHFKIPTASRVGEAFIQLCLNVLFGVNVRGNQCGYRAIRRNQALNVFSDIQYNGFIFATETIVRGALQGLRICEVPVETYDRSFGKSHVNLTRMFISVLQCMLYYSLSPRMSKKVATKVNDFITKIGCIVVK